MSREPSAETRELVVALGLPRGETWHEDLAIIQRALDAAKAEAYEAGQVRMRERSVARIKAMHLCGDHTFEDCPGAAVRVLRAVVDALSDFQPEPYEGEAMSADPKPKRKLPKRKLRVWYEIQGPGDMNGIRLESIEEAKAFVLDYGKEDVTYTLALVCEKVVDWI